MLTEEGSINLILKTLFERIETQIKKQRVSNIYSVVNNQLLQRLEIVGLIQKDFSDFWEKFMNKRLLVSEYIQMEKLVKAKEKRLNDFAESLKLDGNI